MASSVNANPNSSTTVTIPTSTGTTSSIFITGSGGSGGPVYSTNSNYNNTSIRNPSGKTVMEIPSGDPTVKIIGEIEWNGEKLSDRLERIESMLHIPTRDVTMEEKYQKLKQIWDQYKTALEEYKTWQRLKDST